jgi:CheY-like chemotaxis protein
MLVDDNPDDNFFHEREIKQNNPENIVVTQNSATKALEYLKLNPDEHPHPGLIFLDINMPRMNGWEFLEEYSRLDEKIRSRVLIVMLTTSENPDDLAKAKGWSFVADYRSKPLTEGMMEEIINKYFQSQQK